MGLLSLGTNQFWGRIMMFFMQPSKYPTEPHTQFVDTFRMHLFTFIQLSLFVTLYVVKSIKAIAIAFPIIIALCIPLRLYLLPKIFTIEELVMLDSDDDTIKDYFAYKKQTEQDELDKSLQDSSRRKRIKSPSCPPNMLFAPLSSRAISVHPRLSFVDRGADGVGVSSFVGDLAVLASKEDAPVEAKEDTEDVDEEEARDTVQALPPTNQSRRRRPPRAKTLSCPNPHMLFTEANRQMQSNYFFG